MNVDHTEEFAEFARSLGVHAKWVRPTGEIERVPTDEAPKKKSGAYLFFSDGLGGWVQNHSRPDTGMVYWHAERGGDTQEIDKDAERLRIKLWKEAQRKREQERREATRLAKIFFQRCEPLIGGHPYLEKKQLSMLGCHNLRVAEDGALVVPMKRDGELVSVQRIYEDGRKLFWKGASTSGVGFKIGRQYHNITILCEGLATGLALFQSVPDSRLVVAFTASNLVKVAEQLPKKGRVVIAADNDHGTEERRGVNPGLEMAKEAAGVLGCEVAYPDGIEGTDWADYLLEGVAYEQREVYGRRKPELGYSRRKIAGEVSRAMVRNAVYL